MIKSRLRVRRQKKTVSVRAKTLTAGKYVESSAYTGLVATWEPAMVEEVYSAAGQVAFATDVFWFEPTTGSLPTIEEQHVIVDAAGLRYEVISTTSQGGEGNRLKALTRRVK